VGAHEFYQGDRRGSPLLDATACRRCTARILLDVTHALVCGSHCGGFPGGNRAG
jgi:hypothetical protein